MEEPSNIIEKSLKIKYKEYKIELKIKLDIIIINIKNNFEEYESNFSDEYFEKNNLFKEYKTFQEKKQLINNLMSQNKFQIQKNIINLKLIIISYTNIELIINKINSKSLEDTIKNLIEENKNLNEINEQLNNNIKLFKKKNKEQKITIQNYEETIKQLEQKITKLEKLNKIENNKVEIKKYTLNLITSIHSHSDWISSMSIFPSGKLISVSEDKSIKIYDNINYNVIQNITDAHDGSITNLSIKDENNFITCSFDKKIKLWIKKQNIFIQDKIIINAHKEQINKVIYYLNKYLISCACDKTMKIWEEINNKFQLVTTLRHSHWVYSVLIFKERKLILSSGWKETKFWDINNFQLIKHMNDVKCRIWNSIIKINEDKVMIAGENFLKIISLSNLTIIQQIKIPFNCYGIGYLEKEKLFLIGGISQDIMLFKSDNLEYIQTFQNKHEKEINGFMTLKNGLIISYSYDETFKVWSLDKYN